MEELAYFLNQLAGLPHFFFRKLHLALIEAGDMGFAEAGSKLLAQLSFADLRNL